MGLICSRGSRELIKSFCLKAQGMSGACRSCLRGSQSAGAGAGAGYPQAPLPLVQSCGGWGGWVTKFRCCRLSSQAGVWALAAGRHLAQRQPGPGCWDGKCEGLVHIVAKAHRGSPDNFTQGWRRGEGAWRKDLDLADSWGCGIRT